MRGRDRGAWNHLFLCVPDDAVHRGGRNALRRRVAGRRGQGAADRQRKRSQSAATHVFSMSVESVLCERTRNSTLRTSQRYDKKAAGQSPAALWIQSVVAIVTE